VDENCSNWQKRVAKNSSIVLTVFAGFNVTSDKTHQKYSAQIVA